MATSAELVRELLGLGMSRRGIGQAIGRNDRLIGYVEQGVKPGGNLAPALEQLRNQLASSGAPARQAARAAHVEPPPRRTRATGTAARVRRPATVSGGTWTSTTTKQQATRHGARSAGRTIGKAADQGQTVAATASFPRSVQVNATSGSRRRSAPGGGTAVTINLGPADEVLDELNHQHGGDVSEYVAAQLIEAGMVSGADADELAGMMRGLEVRAF